MIVSNKVFLLMHVNDSGDIVEEKFQFNSTKLAQAVYRETTEKRVFYHCDTVGDSVATQCIRGFADMFMSIAPSIFINANGGDNVNGSSLHGKNYVFDIRRTLRQFQDDIQRTMFKLNTIFNAGLSQDTITDCDTTQSVTEQSTDQVFVSSNIMKNCNSNHFICRKMKKRSYAVYVWIDQLILLSFHVIT